MMSNEEEKRCPLCAEEMDWTDQQFMPCKCGYQICVWCWHHIIDMAEKDEAEGRCPACRTIYEKEKIVAMQASCERTKVCNKKTKQPKAKPKAMEVKKDLTNIRVIQRKMAYVIGLPLSLADEDLLLRREYFGQYGKVTKVSLSRTAGGAIQQFTNDTCSVYITFSKEEEALRCIQSVHGYVLEGRFLRASFGTAKYCHAWLKNMPCNNPACLYLHTIGADEDSFGKDEVAAVHTRSRVQQIVGASNNVMKRSGTVLPPPEDDVHISSTTFSDKSTSRSSISDEAHGSGNSTSDTLPCIDKEGPALPQKVSTFVDIVGRASCAPPEKDGNNPEDRRVLDLCSELSSIAVGGETHAEVPYSAPSLYKTPFSNYVGSGFKNSSDEPVGGGSVLYNQGSKDTYISSHRASLPHQFYTPHVSEDLGGAALHRKKPSMTGFTLDQNPVNNRDDEACLPVPTRTVNSTSNDSCQEMKFQNSAKSDRIYRSSQSFSNEEIVEHLRRIDNDNLHNDDENSGLDAVESSIISNIMSIDFDSCEDSFPMPSGLSEILDEADGLGGSSWSSLNSDQSGYSLAKHDGFGSQVASGSILPEYGDNKEPYLSKPQYPVNRAQCLAPPGFSMPSRDPPPGFSNSDRTNSLPRPSSGGRLANASSFPSSLFQPSSVRQQGSSFDDADFFHREILPNGKSNQTNGFHNTMFEARPPSSNPGLNSFEDESRLWLLMQQSASAAHQDPNNNFSQIFAPQIPPSQQDLSFSGLQPRLVDEHQNRDHHLSFFSQMPKQKYANGNGHITNTNGGYMHNMNEVQHKGEVGLTTEVQRNERLGVNYFSGYGGDLMLSSGDVYTRVFGL